MPDISQIKVPSGTVYDIKDATARSAIANLNSFEYVICTSAANTPYGVTWDNGGTTVTGTLAASSSTTSKIYLVPKTNGTNNTYDEYITVNTTGTTYVWEKFGSLEIDLSNLGNLAYADTASASYTPAGSVSLTNSNQTATVSTTSGDATYTPAGSVSLTNSNQTPTISSSAGTSGDNTFQCSGSVAVSSAGATDTVNSATKKTVALTVAAAAPGQTAPTNNLTYYDVTGEVLSLYQLGYTTGDSITTTSKTVKTGDASYSFTGGYVKLANGAVSVPSSASFSGTGVRLVTGNISVPSSASFTGTAATIQVTPDA